MKSAIIDRDALPEHFPTHRHDPMFWEKLGRTVATFGFLEMTLKRAIFALTGTLEYREDELTDEEIDTIVTEWLNKMERTLSDPLGELIRGFKKAVEEHSSAPPKNLKEFVDQLKEASKLRNALCHASWLHPPDTTGASIPLYVTRGHITREPERFESPVDLAFLEQTQKGTVELVCAVMDTVTRTGYQFPGSTSPGKPIMREKGNAPASAGNEQGDLAASDGQESKSPK